MADEDIDAEHSLPGGVPSSVEPIGSGALRGLDAEREWSKGDNHRIVQWRNVLVTHWFAAVSSAALDRCEAASFDLVSRHRGGIVVLNVIDHGLPMPTTEVRKRASAVLAATGEHVLCTATIVRGDGFWASAGRAMVATITLFSRARHPHKVFATPTEGATWCADKVNPVGSTEHFARSMERLTASPR